MEQQIDEAIAKVKKKIEKIDEKLDSFSDLDQRAAVKSITDMEVWDIPIGKAIIGGFTAVLMSELIEGMMPSHKRWIKWLQFIIRHICPKWLALKIIRRMDYKRLVRSGLMKLVAGVAISKFNFPGGLGIRAAALLLAYDGIKDTLPLDDSVAKLKRKLKNA